MILLSIFRRFFSSLPDNPHPRSARPTSIEGFVPPPHPVWHLMYPSPPAASCLATSNWSSSFLARILFLYVRSVHGSFIHSSTFLQPKEKFGVKGFFFFRPIHTILLFFVDCTINVFYFISFRKKNSLLNIFLIREKPTQLQ